MGMFDTIICEYPLPECTIKNFQTKSLKNFMMNYTLTDEGRLIAEEFEYDLVPEEERPYYGTKEWETNSLFSIIGSLRKINLRNVDTNYHGDVVMYNQDEDKNWIEFKVRFTEGVVSKIERV